MSTLNKYLHRAMASPDFLISTAGHVAHIGVNVADALVGHSARKTRLIAQGVSRATNGNPKRFGHLPKNKYSEKIQALADKKSRESRKTRLAVGAGILGVIAAKPKKDDLDLDYTQYGSYGYSG